MIPTTCVLLESTVQLTVCLFLRRTVEVNNTDAEGRLVLGDGVSTTIYPTHGLVLVLADGVSTTIYPTHGLVLVLADGASTTIYPQSAPHMS